MKVGIGGLETPPLPWVGLKGWSSLLVPFVAILGLLGMGCARDEKPAFDVIIYVLDACRPDRIGAYGYERPTTPHIDALVAEEESVLYQNFYVAGNWTKPVTASLFTGTPVHQHGVTEPHTVLEDGRYQTQALGPDLPTLAESFRDAGFSTFALVTSDHLAPRYGFARGFDVYLGPSELEVDDRGRNAKLLQLIAETEGPYFAYVHQNACHNPYPLEDRDPEFMIEYDLDYDEASRSSLGIDFSTNAIRAPLMTGAIQPTAQDIEFLSLVYDAKLRSVDRRVVGPFVEELKRAGRWDRTLLILTADHGEELLEHEGYGHGLSFWEEVIHVPLIVKFPQGKKPSDLPKEIAALAQTTDLFPTLLAYAGLPFPEGIRGKSLFDEFDEFEEGVALSENRGDWALIRDQEKIIALEHQRPALYDLKADPEERHDLASREPERLQALQILRESMMASQGVHSTPALETELNEDAVERLRSLGYLE